ncbi:hypothetical protein MNBD_GAMMA09-3750 [hydrothermal vent metagenome]|uniref:Uncharacterized protein n=1 Tax=hydrothermal vent metagenome TaxID=652676 RepID=A0A3B0XDZ4_9ZZZZ
MRYHAERGNEKNISSECEAELQAIRSHAEHGNEKITGYSNLKLI